MPRSRSARRPLPALSSLGEEHIAEALPLIRRVRLLQETYATPIIADGIFNNTGGLWWDVLDSVARQDDHEVKIALNAFFDRLQSAGFNTEITYKLDSGETETLTAVDVCNHYASTWGDAGFWLGLAVGMQLGPEALKGGAR
jgi:hypothetical protein